ncbi:MAG TPA: GNAT family N-acetyltransferase [Tepidisphaeraceae bacterium]|jgi:tagatose 1,6-diphosphate aldolase
MRFQFLDPGPLVDRELTLVPPTVHYLDEVLNSCRHPLTVRDAPQEAAMTRQRLLDFCHVAPGGRQSADLSKGWVPAYHFWMRLDPPLLTQGEVTPFAPGASDPSGTPSTSPSAHPITMAGGIGVRIGTTREIELYSGNIGYHVYPPARGHHYAERSVRLVLSLIKRHGLSHVWITTNPDNLASRRTCERLGATLVDTVTVPKNHPFRQRGETTKCRYLLRV